MPIILMKHAKNKIFINLYAAIKFNSNFLKACTVDIITAMTANEALILAYGSFSVRYENAFAGGKNVSEKA